MYGDPTFSNNLVLCNLKEKLEASALQMAWVIGAVWTKQRQAELARHFAGALHSLRIASDLDYAAHIQVRNTSSTLNSLLCPAGGQGTLLE